MTGEPQQESMEVPAPTVVPVPTSDAPLNERMTELSLSAAAPVVTPAVDAGDTASAAAPLAPSLVPPPITTTMATTPASTVAPAPVKVLDPPKAASDEGFTKLLDRCHLFVGDLHRTTTEEDLQEVFKPYGGIVFAEVKRDKLSGRNLGYGFLKLDSEAGAERALREMNGVSLKGRRIRVNYAQKNCELLVTNLAEEVTRDELLPLFASHGPLDEDHCVLRPPEPAYAAATGGKAGASAIVKFRFRQHAENARDALNNRASVRGAVLRVDWHVKDNKRFRFKVMAPGPYGHMDPAAMGPPLVDPKLGLRGWMRPPHPMSSAYGGAVPFQLRITVVGRAAMEVKRGSLVATLKRVHEPSPIGEVRLVFSPPTPGPAGEFRRIFVADIQQSPEGIEAMDRILQEAAQPQGIRLKGCRIIVEPHYPSAVDFASYSAGHAPGFYNQFHGNASPGYPYMISGYADAGAPPTSPGPSMPGPPPLSPGYPAHVPSLTSFYSMSPPMNAYGGGVSHGPPAMGHSHHGAPHHGHALPSHPSSAGYPHGLPVPMHAHGRVPAGGAWDHTYGSAPLPTDPRSKPHGVEPVPMPMPMPAETREARGEYAYGYAPAPTYGGAYPGPAMMGYYPAAESGVPMLEAPAYMPMGGAPPSPPAAPGALHPYYAMPYPTGPPGYSVMYAAPNTLMAPEEPDHREEASQAPHPSG